MEQYVTYKWEKYNEDFYYMSVGNQPLIACMKLGYAYYKVKCVYPSPEIYEREIKFFLRCTFESLSYEEILTSAKENKFCIAKHYI